MDTKKAVESLRTFVQTLVRARITTKKQFRDWKKKPANEAFMAKCLGYKRKSGMPSVTALVDPHFHPDLPLVGLNYTGVAHNTLHAFPDGWTPAIRNCRGIIFDRRGKLVALPFPKFFNYGEHPETTNVPDEPFTATEKHDGHLGIIFEYGGKLHLATRVTFDGPSAKLGNAMLKRFAKERHWPQDYPANLTLLVEIIHPKTKVHLDYAGREDFILIGAYDRGTLADCDDRCLRELARLHRIAVAERWEGESLDDLRALVKDPTIRNREGLVVRFASGIRRKDKFETYIGLMVASKLTYGYLMNRLLDGKLERMISTLPEEIVGEARDMVARIQSVSSLEDDEKSRREYLYGLDAKRQKNSYYRGICRKYLSAVSGKPKRATAKKASKKAAKA